jgi:purine-cytosine permease-like protein
MIPAAAATFGPKLGLRQMTSARFSWGWWGAKIVALLNCIACVGWSSVNTIAGAQTLRVVADERISHAVGVVVLAIATLIVGFLGYKYVHIYERFSWIPTFIAFLIMLGVGAPHFYKTPMPVGRGEAANVLSFGATMFGFAVGWVSLASDYNTVSPSPSEYSFF